MPRLSLSGSAPRSDTRILQSLHEAGPAAEPAASAAVSWRMVGFLLVFLGLFTPDVEARRGGGASSALLRESVEIWLGERDEWAFTQRAIEYEQDGPFERLERFDPSRPASARWELLAVNGKDPTPQQRKRWAEKKFRRNPRPIDTSIGDFFDFRAATVVSETSDLVRFNVPLKKEKRWLFPVEKIGVHVTLNRQTRAVEHVSAEVREPFKVLLGLARVTGGVADIDFLHADAEKPKPEEAQAAGVIKVSAFKFGDRVDFTWSEFKRVPPARTAAARDRVSMACLE